VVTAGVVCRCFFAVDYFEEHSARTSDDGRRNRHHLAASRCVRTNPASVDHAGQYVAVGLFGLGIGRDDASKQTAGQGRQEVVTRLSSGASRADFVPDTRCPQFRWCTDTASTPRMSLGSTTWRNPKRGGGASSVFDAFGTTITLCRRPCQCRFDSLGWRQTDSSAVDGLRCQPVAGRINSTSRNLPI
jgi:hypothetical protein